MRLTFEGQSMEAIFEQMALTLGAKIRDDELTVAVSRFVAAEGALATAEAEEQRLRTMVKERDTKLKEQRLRIEELEQHLAHAVGTKDLMLIQAPAKMPDSLKEAIAEVKVAETDATMTARFEQNKGKKEIARRYEVDEELSDVDRAKKVRSDFDGTLPQGVWRLTIPQYQRFMRAPWQGDFKSTEMPNGEWIVNTEKRDG